MTIASEPLADFGAWRDEYAAAVESAALFDRSAVGHVEVAGPEAPQFLHNLSTNDVANMPLGAGCEAFFCNLRARALFHVHIYHVMPGGRHALWLDVTPGYHEKLIQHLDRYLIAEQVELADRTGDLATLHVAGPSSRDVLSKAVGQALPELQLYQHMERALGSLPIHVRRIDPLGVPGWDVVVRREHLREAWDRLSAAGAPPAGTTAFDVLRIEAGTPVYGPDIDENRFVVEVGRKDAISYTKGCYLGQEPIVMARDRAGHLNRYFRGLRFGEAVAAGAKLFAGEGEVGLVTSSADSPRLGPIGLGYVRRGHEPAGTALHVVGPTGPGAVVAELPIEPADGAK